METVRMETWSVDQRRVVVWRSRIEDTGPGPVVVLCPGFGRRMTDLVTVALYLTLNGATVYRMDPLDHVGLSDGTIFEYTPTATASSFRAVLDLVHGIEGTREVVMVAASMAARPAIRVALEGGVDRLVTVVGVVHMRRTIGAVFGRAIVELPGEELPPSVWFEDLEIGPRHIYDDQAHGWFEFDVTCEELDRLRIPAVAIHSNGDPWVDAAEIRQAYARRRGQDRDLIEIRSDVHDLGQDPAAGLLALEAIAGAATRRSAVRIPSLDQLVAAIGEERAMEQVPA